MRQIKKRDSRESPSPEVTVEVVPSAAVPLIEVHPTSKLWVSPASMPKTLSAMRGAFVKAQPPPDATDAEIDALKAALERTGAAHVRVLPRQRAQATVPDVAGLEEVPEAHRDLRGAAVAVAQASTYPDKPALLAVVEELLGEAGL
jgi:hypothetical protein